MMKNKEWKIRRMLGERYFLFTKGEEWSLYKFKSYAPISDEPIMTSKTNTVDDLYKFAKKNRVYDLSDILNLMPIIVFILTLINIIIVFTTKNNFVRGIIMGALFILLIIDIIVFHMSEHNFKIEMKELEIQLKERKNRK